MPRKKKKKKGKNVPKVIIDLSNFVKCQALLMVSACQTEAKMSASQNKWKKRLYYFLIALPNSNSARILLHFMNLGSGIFKCDNL